MSFSLTGWVCLFSLESDCPRLLCFAVGPGLVCPICSVSWFCFSCHSVGVGARSVTLPLHLCWLVSVHRWLRHWAGCSGVCGRFLDVVRGSRGRASSRASLPGLCEVAAVRVSLGVINSVLHCCHLRLGKRAVPFRRGKVGSSLCGSPAALRVGAPQGGGQPAGEESAPSLCF